MDLSKKQFEEMFDQLFEIEMKSVVDVVKAAKKSKQDDTVVMGHSYIMGLQRGRDMIQIVLNGVKDE